MVKEFLIAHPRVKILGKKYVKLKRKNSSFQKLLNIPSITKTQGRVVFQSYHISYPYRKNVNKKYHRQTDIR